MKPSADSLRQMLEQLQTTLSEVEAAQRAKLGALKNLNAPALYESAEVERHLAESLLYQRQSRQALLEQDDNASEPFQEQGTASLRSLIGELPSSDRSALLEMLDSIQSRAERIKEQVALNWLTTWRLNEYVSDMLEIVAHAGQPAMEEVHHGLMLDSQA